MSKLAEFLKSSRPTANPANPNPTISSISNISTLESRIRLMAARWKYSEEELIDALKRAAQNPAGWLTCVEDDETKQLWKL
jgi:hypothetical protein